MHVLMRDASYCVCMFVCVYCDSLYMINCSFVFLCFICDLESGALTGVSSWDKVLTSDSFL